MCGRIKESYWAITKLSPSDNSREVLPDSIILILHQTTMWLTQAFMTIIVQQTEKIPVAR